MPRLRSRSRDGRVARMQPPGWRGGSPGPLGRQDDCRGSASRERNHGVGDHPIPFRTRQLSPTSPKVLRRQAAGGQVVPLAGGAFLRSGRPDGTAGPAGPSPTSSGEPVRQNYIITWTPMRASFCFKGQTFCQIRTPGFCEIRFAGRRGLAWHARGNLRVARVASVA